MRHLTLLFMKSPQTNLFAKTRTYILLAVIFAGVPGAVYFARSSNVYIAQDETAFSPEPLTQDQQTIKDDGTSVSASPIEEPVPADKEEESVRMHRLVSPILLPDAQPISHISTPDTVRAIYMSQCVAGTPSFRQKLVDLVDRTELNALVIDIRDYSGKIGIPVTSLPLAEMVSDECGAGDMRSFIDSLHAKGIYVIGRITVFQNPEYVRLHPEHAVQKTGGGIWKDYKGLAFVDVGAEAYWETVAELGRIAYKDFGFDELNFDYVRYPSDGPMTEAEYTWSEGRPKAEVLEAFFKYLHGALAPTGAVLSVDLFGMVATNYDDLNIGQVLERALPYFDYVSPMVYPSHYPKGWNGLAEPAKYPYEVVHLAMSKAVLRTQMLGMPPTKIRPWLQDFNLGATYTAEMVRKQMQAAYDAGLTSWYLWDAGNTYTEEALEKDA